MKQSYILKTRELELVEGSRISNGDQVLSGDSSLRASIERRGADLNGDTGGAIVVHHSGEVGGLPIIRQKPQIGGLLPRNFSEPVEYSLSSDPDAEHYEMLGTSEYDCREWKRFSTDGTGYSFPNFSKGLSSHLFSFNGRLFFATDFYVSVNGRWANYAHLFEWNEEDEVFFLKKRFDEIPVDLAQNGLENQTGSPTCFEHAGSLYVAYRRSDRASDLSVVVLYKMESERFVLISETTITNSFAKCSEFRLRGASDGFSLILVYYGIETVTRAISAVTIQHNDMRSLVSYDDGESFKTSAERFESVYTSQGRVSRVSKASSLHKMFIKEFTAGYAEDDMLYYNTGFDLYYDEDMASFVVIKGGHPSSNEANGNHLIAIKTVRGNLNEWERCAVLRLNAPITGAIGRADDTVWYPFYNSGDGASENLYIIEDISVASRDGEKIIAISCKITLSSEGVQNSREVAIAPFRFISDQMISPGFYDEVIGYGTKGHADYTFLIGPVNKDYTGMSGSGSHGVRKNVFNGRICFYRNHLVGTDRRTQSGRLGNLFLCFMGGWSNITEKYGYEFAWPGVDIEEYPKYGITLSTGGSGTATAALDGYISFAATASHTAWMSVGAISGVSSDPHILERITERSPTKHWKTRFKAWFQSVSSGTFEFLDGAIGSSSSGYGMKLRLTNTGTISVITYGGSVREATAYTLDPDVWYEFMVGFCEGRSGNTCQFVFCRQEGSLQWEKVYQFDGVTVDSVTSSKMYYGIPSSSGVTSLSVRIRDVQIGGYSNGYRPVWSYQKFVKQSGLDGPALYNESKVSYTNPWMSSTKTYDQYIELWDGGRLRLYGQSEPISEHSYEVQEIGGTNSSSNLLGQTVGSHFDMVPYLTSGALEIIFKNPNRYNWTAVGLFGIYGISRVDIKTGDYNESTGVWATSNTEAMYVPKVQITPVSYSGKTLIVSEEFEDDDLVGKCIAVYNPAGSEYTSQYFVVKSIGSVLFLDSSVVIPSGHEVYLFREEGVWEPSSTITDRDYQYVSLTFNAIDTYRIVECAQVIFGNIHDISGYTIDVVNVMGSESKIGSTYTGYLHSSISAIGYTTRRHEFNLTGNAAQSRDHRELSSLIKSVFERESVVGICYLNNNGVQEYYLGAITEPVSNNAGYLSEHKFVFVDHDYAAHHNVSYEHDAPIIARLLASATDETTGTSITFRVEVVDPAGQYPLTFAWDFGDTNTATGLFATHSYSSSGIYTVTLVVTNSNGVTATGSIVVTIREKSISQYDYTLSASEPLSTATPYTLTLQAQDRDSVDITDDNRTMVVLVEADADLTFDVEFSRLTSGEAEFIIESSSTGDKDILFRDVNGVAKEITVTFA